MKNNHNTYITKLVSCKNILMKVKAVIFTLSQQNHALPVSRSNSNMDPIYLKHSIYTVCESKIESCS